MARKEYKIKPNGEWEVKKIDNGWILNKFHKEIYYETLEDLIYVVSGWTTADEGKVCLSFTFEDQSNRFYKPAKINLYYKEEITDESE